uniref:HMG box domain-containing protein n=1 Tax=Mycena chlorophos TaxID=658473 RepID=A0ABQ0L9Y9_MYCCL|nr:predicted protein [Mycena chlorophos]
MADLVNRDGFTTAQEAAIRSHYAAWRAVLEAGTTRTSRRDWKNTTASQLLDSPSFSSVSPSRRRGVHAKIARKFGNHRHHQHLVDKAALTTILPDTRPAEPNPLLPRLPTGREMYADAHAEEISRALRGHAADAPNRPVYQSVLKGLWDALSAEEREDWNSEAKARAGDVAKNQANFAGAMSLAARDICQSGRFGDGELLVLFSFRAADGEDLVAGCVEGHCKSNTMRQRFLGAQLESEVGMRFAEWTDDVLPRKLSQTPNVPELPRNTTGQLNFPALDIDNIMMKIADLRALLVAYLDCLWADARRGSAVEWSLLISDASKCYDTTAFVLPINLDDPRKLSTAEVLSLAQHLVETSGTSSPVPFSFLPHSDLRVSPPAALSAPITPPASPKLVRRRLTTPPSPVSSLPDVDVPPVAPPSPVALRSPVALPAPVVSPSPAGETPPLPMPVPVVLASPASPVPLPVQCQPPATPAVPASAESHNAIKRRAHALADSRPAKRPRKSNPGSAPISSAPPRRTSRVTGHPGPLVSYQLMRRLQLSSLLQFFSLPCFVRFNFGSIRLRFVQRVAICTLVLIGH